MAYHLIMRGRGLEEGSRSSEQSGLRMRKSEPSGHSIEISGDDADEVVAAGLAFQGVTGAKRRPIVNILFLSANPTGTQALELIKECNNIRDKVSSTKYGSDIFLDQRHEASLGKLQSYLLQGRPNIVHFSGHGEEGGTLVFQDFEGRPESAKVKAISDLFNIINKGATEMSSQANRGDRVTCVVLNACYSSKQAKSLSKYVDCVIGMKNAISDDAARVFAESFYQALGHGESLGTAFDLGKNQVALLNLPGQDIPKMENRDGKDPYRIFMLERD